MVFSESHESAQHYTKPPPWIPFLPTQRSAICPQTHLKVLAEDSGKQHMQTKCVYKRGKMCFVVSGGD